jgi:DNA primase
MSILKQVKLIPIGSILRQYGIEARRQENSLVAAKCPLPTHTSNQTNTFKVNIKGNYWVCYSESCRAALGYKGGDGIDFVCFMDGIDRREPKRAIQKLAEVFAVTSKNGEKTDTSNGTVSQAQSVPEIRNKPLGFVLETNPEHPEIQKRGISSETAREWGVGFFSGKGSMAGRIIFPLYEPDIGLVGYAGRTVEAVTEENPKWRLGKGLVKNFLYGLERCDPAKMLIVAESYWSPLFFGERGHQACAIGGTEMTEEQERSLEPYGTIILAMDGDQAGRNAADKIAGRLRGKHRVIRSILKE